MARARVVVVVVVVAVLMAVGMDSVLAQDYDDVISSCQSEQDCHQATPNSFCFQDDEGGVANNNNVTSYCRCLPSHHNNDDQSGTCSPNKIGDACKNHTDCSDVIDNSHCPIRVEKCRCKSGYLKNGDDACKEFEIGTPCRTSEQCQVVIGNSRCFRGLDGQKACTCKRGYYIPGTNDINDKKNDNLNTHEAGNSSSNSCKPIPLNGLCSTQDDCRHLPFTVCQNVAINTLSKSCVCISGYREEDKNTQNPKCVRTLANTACDVDEHCLEISNNSICDFHTGFCNCPYKLTEDESSCYFQYLGDPCTVNEDCREFVPDSQCSNDKVCTCKDDYLPHTNKSVCLAPVIEHKNCTNDITCQLLVPYSFCRRDDNVCSCQTGYDVTSDFNHCEAKNLLDSCSSNEECSTTNPFSECSGSIPKVCRCSSGHVLEESRQPDAKSFCRRRVLGRHDCLTQTDCTDAVNDSVCIQCRDMKEAHPYCASKCTGVDIEYCTVSTCLCRIGFYSEKGDTQCKKRQLWDECSVDEDCSAIIPNSVCPPSGKCYCQSGYVPLGLDRCQKLMLEDGCHTDENCHDAIANSYCNKNPQHGTVFNTDDDDADDDDDDDDNDDDGNQFGICSCLSGYNPVDSTMCQKRQIGDKTCSANSDCDDAVPGSLCTNGMCVCRHGFFPGFDLYSCSPRTLHGPYCSADRDCDAIIPHSRCAEHHKCVCKIGYRVETENECVPFELDDAGCRDVDDCANAVENSTCVSVTGSRNNSVSICACAIGYHPDIVNNQTCVPRNISGHFCQKDEECFHSVANSHCKDEQCACVSGYYHKADGTLCIKRVLGDDCNVTSDCDDVISHSTCNSRGLCSCDPEFDSHQNGTSCFLKPVKIGLPCISDGQCRAIDKSSECSSKKGDVIKTCACPDGMFVGVSLKECVKFPTKTKDRCRWDSHCKRYLDNSVCHNKTRACVCDKGYFEDDGGRVCAPMPTQFGDHCLVHAHCSKMGDNSVCDGDNSTCICQYGYTQKSNTQCVERPSIPAYKRQKDPNPPVECKGTCQNQNNTICVEVVENSISHCQCDYRYATATNKINCVPAQSYSYKLRLTKEAGTYDYEPLPFKHQYKSSQLLAYKRFALRITHGIFQTVRKTPLKLRFVSSEVLNFEPLETESSNQSASGVEATVLLHLEATYKYYKATPASYVGNVLSKQLQKTSRELGESKLLLGFPLKRSSVVTDFDECVSGEHNDCAKQASCVNTEGSFMCVCRSDHIDVSSSNGKRTGRACTVPETTVVDNALCSTADCETRWEFVGLVLTLVFLIVMAFIVYEIIQRKQNFNARKLYERFGTTRIRRLKLTTAGLKRLQERKKYRKKYKKRMKKEMKRNNRRRWFGGKKKVGSGTDDSDGEKSCPPTPNMMEAEEIPESPSEIMHTPSLPTMEDGEYTGSDDDDDGDDAGAGGGGGGAAAASAEPEMGLLGIEYGADASPVTLHPTSLASGGFSSGGPDNSVSVFMDD